MYTKHIYMGSQRIVSKIGDLESFGADPRRVVYAGHGVDGIDEVDFAGKYQTATSTIKERYQSFDLEYKGEENNDYVNGQGFCCTDNPLGRDGARTVSDTKDGETPERLIYFYHSDHLGSSSLITNFDGEVTQHVEYIPYGEIFMEERNSSFSTPYLFNAKELDDETGLYYYGARYFDPTGAMWLSVDPLFEKYAGMSPYNYCSGNPVKFIDPDGMDYYSSTDENGNEVIQWQDSEKAFYIDEDGNSWEYYSAGQKEEVVITPTQEQKQDIKEKRAEEQDRNIKNYWSERAKNADSWEAKFGYWLKSKGGYNADEKFSEAARPIVQGAVLLNPLVGIPNDIITIFTGEDIYGNEATSVDKGFAVVDLASFGFAKYLKIGSAINKFKSVPTKTSMKTMRELTKARKVNEKVGNVTTGYSVGAVIYNGYSK
jgi:RHS repeat-associated protein